METSSKTAEIQALLLRAWRERWSDLQWGIHIKTILPRGVSGDVHKLAECILDKALVGSGPNDLVLSYLKHSLSSQLVSFSKVLAHISTYDSFNKTHCIIILLEFVESILGRMTSRSRAEEADFSGDLLSLVNWLLMIVLYAINEMPNKVEYSTMILKPTSILKQLLNCDFARAMLCLARMDSTELHSQVVLRCKELEKALSKPLPVEIGLNNEETIKTLQQLRKLGPPLMNTELTNDDNDTSEAVTYCLQPLIAVDVILDPSRDNKFYVNQLLMVQRMKGYSNARLYAEIMRSCFISLRDVSGSNNDESLWGAVTFLKIPIVLLQLHRHFTNESGGEKREREYSQDMLDGVDLLLEHSPLLNMIDVIYKCNAIEYLAIELARVGLITETHVKSITAKRVNAVVFVDINPEKTPKLQVIIKAESTVARTLKTLSVEYAKSQEASFGILSQVLKSFELILTVAAVEGKLRPFVSKLMNHNELSCAPSSDEKEAMTRAMLFDITFLMLCHIAQAYGLDVIVDENTADSKKYFFEKFAKTFLSLHDKPAYPDIMLKHSDSAKVDQLISQFISPESEFKTIQVNWKEYCSNIPAVTRELLFAWEQQTLSTNDVKTALDAMRSQMGCLPVCASAWLCSYMQILEQDALLKPMNMVQEFLRPIEESSLEETFHERLTLTHQIIRKMQYDLNPSPSSKSKIKLSHNIVSSNPICEQLSSVWLVSHKRGWVTIEGTQILESLFHLGGANWFVTNILKEMLKYRYRDELDKAVDLAFAFFHFNIETCTLELLENVLPLFLHNKFQSDELVEPQASALAKLACYCIFSTLETSSMTAVGSSGPRKRQRTETEDIDKILPTNKNICIRNSTDSQESTSIFDTVLTKPSSVNPVNSDKREPMLKDPLKQVLLDLFQAFEVIAKDGEISQHTHFVFRFLEYCISCGKDRSRLVLNVLPVNLIPNLLSSLPDLFTTELILSLHDINSSTGRKDIARDLCMLRNMTLQPQIFSFKEFTCLSI